MGGEGGGGGETEGKERKGEGGVERIERGKGWEDEERGRRREE